MIRIFSLLLLSSVASGMTCSELKTTYKTQQCCSNSSADTCLRSLPDCTDDAVVAGQICTDTNGNAFVKGLLDAFDLSDVNKLLLKKHLVPNGNAVFDIGEAENKIRHFYLSNT